MECASIVPNCKRKYVIVGNRVINAERLKIKGMKIYIASSWKNVHAVEMLTAILRERGHEVLSFVENNYGEGHGAEKPINFEDWMKTDQAYNSFYYDSNGAMTSDLVIYISPS